MANPWEEYQRPASVAQGPWQEYAATAGPSRMPPINETREAPSQVRAMAGLKVGPEGVARYLESRYGPGNVATDKGGAFYVKDRGEWIPFDSPDLNARDVFDMSGAAVAAVPVVGAEALAARAGRALVGALARGGTGGLLGSVAQQATGVATPGGDPMPTGARVQQALLDTAAGVGGEAVSRGANRFVQGVRNTYITQTGKAATPVAQEGQRVEQFLGEPLTPGQLSQRRSLLTLEGALRRSPTKAADIMADMDTRQLIAARTKFTELLDRMSANPATAETLGLQVGQAFDTTLTAARNVRRNQARSDFAAIDSAAGRAPIFKLGETVAALDDLIQRYQTPGGGDVTASLVRQLRGARDALADARGNLANRSAQEVQRLMEVYGEAANGTGKVFNDIETAQQRRIGGLVRDALERDMGNTVAAAAPGSPLAAALTTARNNYRLNSQAIDELRKSAIGQYLGFRETGTIAPEMVAERLAGMKPTQLRQTFALLGKADPELAGATKRFMVERAMYAAEPSAEKIAERLGAGQVPEDYSPARLLGNLVKSSVLDVLDPNEKLGVQMLTAAFKRLANRGGTEGSPTAPLMWAMDIAKNFATAGLAGDVMGAIRMVPMVFGPTKLAEAITNRNATQALYRLTQPNLNREAAIAALTTLGLMTPSRVNAEDVRPFGAAMPGQTPTSIPR